MRILIEAHHPGDIHFWKYPIKLLMSSGHHVHMIARERDVMHRLLKAYDWIPFSMPTRASLNNSFPLTEFIKRQFAISRAIHTFNPDVVASLFGSYTQSAGMMGIRNVIFTDSEFQHFNHRIAHPFASEIHTPYCYYKGHGRKQHYYDGIHELSFLSKKYFVPDDNVLKKYTVSGPFNYIVIRLSAWNTLHDVDQQGISALVERFIESVPLEQEVLISAEEDSVSPTLKKYCNQFAPEDFHNLLAHASFVLTEGASTASEAACLGVPTVYVNSTEPRGYLEMLERRYKNIRNFRNPDSGVKYATKWISEAIRKTRDQRFALHAKITDDHADVCDYVVNTLTHSS